MIFKNIFLETHNLPILAKVQIQHPCPIIRGALQLVEGKLPELRLGGGHRRRRSCWRESSAIVEEEATIYVHNQLTLPALEQAAKGELPLVVDRLVGALDEGPGPRGHVAVRLRAQPIDEHTAGGAAADAEHRGLLALPKGYTQDLLYVFSLNLDLDFRLTFSEELLPAPARRVVARA